jgi:hypothetical protein
VFFPRSSVGDLPTIVAGEGVYLRDDQGRRLLDVCSGPFLANLGLWGAKSPPGAVSSRDARGAAAGHDDRPCPFVCCI